MTIGTVRNALNELADLLDAVDASSQAKAVRALSTFLEAHAHTATAVFFRKAAPQREVGAGWAGQRVGNVLPALRAYRGLLEHVGSKAAKETGLLTTFLEPYGRSGLAELIDAAEEALNALPRGKVKAASVATNEEIVDNYVARLTPALGSDREFENVFAQLKDDKAVRKQEMVEIAKRLMLSQPSSRDRKSVLGAIHNLHRSARGFDRRLKAMSGRSAA
jgi:hypothetical protein